ncbi:hypothetical protein ACHAWF_003821 [Thalassiosira exigua]
MLLALLTRTFKSRVIVFFDAKSAAHRLMIVCGLCGIKCGELHGNLTQVQRLEALEAFREGSVDVLLCTDLAARGLDVEAVEAVVNFEMPSQVETYVHRIGRTARAGRGGKACTLIGEGRRYLMKEVIKDAEEKNRRQKQDNMSQPTGVIRSRTIPQAVVAHFVAKINSLEPSVKEVMDAEAVARLDRITEMEAIRAKNIIEHSEEIEKRPKREWFASAKQKISVKQASAERKRLMEEKVGTGKHRMTRKKRRAQEAREMLLEAKEESERSGEKTKIVFTNAEIKGSARASKRNEARREKESASRSLNDEDVRKKRIQKQKQKAVASDAAGDGGLFSEEKVAFSKKSKEEEERAPAKSRYVDWSCWSRWCNLTHHCQNVSCSLQCQLLLQRVRSKHEERQEKSSPCFQEPKQVQAPVKTLALLIEARTIFMETTVFFVPLVLSVWHTLSPLEGDCTTI